MRVRRYLLCRWPDDSGYTVVLNDQAPGRFGRSPIAETSLVDCGLTSGLTRVTRHLSTASTVSTWSRNLEEGFKARLTCFLHHCFTLSAPLCSSSVANGNCTDHSLTRPVNTFAESIDQDVTSL